MGNNHFGQLGYPIQDSTASLCNEPQIVASLQNSEIVQIGAGAQFSIALTQGDLLYAWGRGDCGQLGLGLRATNEEPQVCNRYISGRVSWFRCGPNTMYVATENGRVYCCGDNSQGALGMGQQNIFTELTYNTHLKSRVKDIRPGMSHCIFLKRDGRLMVSGSNSSGQLGCPDITLSKVPIESEYFKSANVSIIAAGNFSACVLSGKDIFIWGLSKSETSPIKVTISGASLEELALCSNTLLSIDEDRTLWTIALQGRSSVGVKTGSVEGRAVKAFGVGKGFWIGTVEPIPQKFYLENQFNSTRKHMNTVSQEILRNRAGSRAEGSNKTHDKPPRRSLRYPPELDNRTSASHSDRQSASYWGNQQ